MSINILQPDFFFDEEWIRQASGINKFCIRDYVAGVRERDPSACWPFGSVCEYKDLNAQDVASESLSLNNLKITEDTNAPESLEAQNSKSKEVVVEDPTAFTLKCTNKDNTGSEISTAAVLLEISKGKNTQIENASAFQLALTEEVNTGYESDTATEIIISDGMDENMSDGGTELVNLSESENEEIVKGDGGGSKPEIVVISDDDDDDDIPGKSLMPPKKRKRRVLSDILKDLARPDVESTQHFADKVDEYTDKSDEDFTIGDEEDEDDSDDDTLHMLIKKRKAVKISSRSNRSRIYKKRKTRGPKGSKARTKRAKPHDNFAPRKLANVVSAEVALPATRKRCGTGGSVVGVGGSKDPGMPGKRQTMVCLLNKNPTEFTIVGPGNKYMRRY